MTVPLIEIANNKDKFPTIGDLFGEDGKDITSYQNFFGNFAHILEIRNDTFEILPYSSINDINAKNYNDIFTPIIKKKLVEISNYIEKFGSKNDLIVSITLSDLKYHFSGHRFADIENRNLDKMKSFIIKCRIKSFHTESSGIKSGEESIRIVDLFKQWDSIDGEDRVMICNNKLIPRIMDELEMQQKV